MPLVPKSFIFSWKITIICIVLASVMVVCSFWQWDRYLKKVELVQTYEKRSTTPAIPIEGSALDSVDVETLKYQKVALKGRYDFSQQVISTNKKHASGPGHWLLTPFKVAGSDKYVIVSRGFIPFADRERSTWGKYDGSEGENTEIELEGVLKASIEPRLLGPKNPKAGPGHEFQPIWYYEEIDKIASQLPYPVVTSFFIQRLGAPATGEFPAEAVSIEVPPSTHFGYTIEWAILAFVTLAVGYILQAFPWYMIRHYRQRAAPPPEEV